MKMLLIILALFLFAPTSHGQKSSDGKTKQDEQKPPSSRVSSPAQKFVWEALCSGMNEARLSEIALRKSKDAEVRHFAEMMVTDHGKVNLRLRQIADLKNLETPQTTQLTMTRDGREMPRQKESARRDKESVDNVGAIRNAMDPAFATAAERRQYKQEDEKANEANKMLEKAAEQDVDRLYVKLMNEDHQLAVKKFEMASRELQDSDLKEFASSTLPTLREHLDHAKQLASKHPETAAK